MRTVKITTEVDPEVAKAIEAPLIELPRKVDESRELLEEALHELSIICLCHGACS